MSTVVLCNTVKRIQMKNTKTTEEYIKIMSNGNQTMYSYIKICDNPIHERSKHTFNKDAFIQYLQSIGIPSKYIKEVM